MSENATENNYMELYGTRQSQVHNVVIHKAPKSEEQLAITQRLKRIVVSAEVFGMAEMPKA